MLSKRYGLLPFVLVYRVAGINTEGKQHIVCKENENTQIYAIE